MTKLRKIKNVYQVFSNLHLKKDTRANVYPFVFISSSVVCIYVQYILVLIKEDQNFIKGICHVKLLLILTNEKTFPKSVSQSEFGYGLLTKLS